MVTSMASILDGGDYRPELSIPLHHAMSMSCDSSPPGMGMSNTYTTLTPLQPLPPISTVSDKFHHPHPHPHPHPHHHHHHHQQRLSGNVSGSFALLRDERGLPAMNSLYSPYKEMPGMGQSLSPLAATPLGNGLGGLHNAQQSLPNYGPPGPDKMLSPNFDAHHTAMLTRGDQHLSRGLGTPPAAMMSHLNGLHHPGHAQSHGPVLAPSRERPPSSSSGSQVATSGQLEEINTKEVAQRITAELKRYSIPQAIFAQRVLCRSQGTLSDLLRNPKPWSKLKSGRETFRRMWKWLQEPEFQRMSALRLAGKLRGPREVQPSIVLGAQKPPVWAAGAERKAQPGLRLVPGCALLCPGAVCVAVALRPRGPCHGLGGAKCPGAPPGRTHGPRLQAGIGRLLLD
ncbi:hypothetical protein FD755_009872 [Muntiacus reevesi]|uniref:CUT domain-containing protein n=1 Tax=Muntiacus reevesi TaxID=9886 RepID=A0A5N3XWS6_MUNRE|nr:hypothetical protein FD755_009872 [Muntiacus reevesi]